ncbi:MAG: methyltransferase domain-containing protein [Candidatus Krumholzibacteriota bacterium]|nr:methyltransferase domain-containing protein [Candidatus Krumholzibacteriota bacterium]
MRSWLPDVLTRAEPIYFCGFPGRDQAGTELIFFSFPVPMKPEEKKLFEEYRMEPPLSPELLRLLACPDCRRELRPSGASLCCPSCGREYEVKNGVPLLFPVDLDPFHLQEEEKLGGIMKNLPPRDKDHFREEQWRLSKEEFWNLVEERMGGPGRRTIANIGCGVDTRFLKLSPPHTFIALDLMYELLEGLMENRPEASTGRTAERPGSVHRVAGAVQALPFKNDSFDGLCCIDLIHHEPEHLAMIIESFHAVLKPGGMLFLEDINAWAMFQFYKSIFLPRGLHRRLRALYHRLRKSPFPPAPYEFPTSVWKVKKFLARAGFEAVRAVPQLAYPNTGKSGVRLYRWFGRIGHWRRYHNFHYLLTARKP